MTGRYCFTIDTDWAAPAMVRHILDIFERYGIKVTVFVTNELDPEMLRGHEISLHPNSLDDGSESSLVSLTRRYPGARGVRFHGLHFDYRLLAEYDRYGISYDSSYVMYNEPGISPFRLSASVWQIPVFFMDYIYLDPAGPATKARTFSARDISLGGSGVKVFDFHPQHVYLNTRDLDTYFRAKPFMRDLEALEAFRNLADDTPGTASMLASILEYVRCNDCETCTMSEVLLASSQGRPC